MSSFELEQTIWQIQQKPDLCLKCSTRRLGFKFCGYCQEAHVYRVCLRKPDDVWKRLKP